MVKEVKVYSTPTCPYCKLAKEFLKKNKIKFRELDVSTDKKAAEEVVKKSGQRGVPVLDIGGKIVVGFNEEKISKLLGI